MNEEKDTSGKATTVWICGRKVSLGDYVEVEYTSGTWSKGGRIRGKITELWSPELNDGHLQGRVENGWCFHNEDRILEHKTEVQP